jgi:hypothetical protein
MRTAIFIGLMLFGSWVKAQTFELAQDSAVTGEKVQLSWVPGYSMDTASGHYWWKRVGMEAGTDTLTAKVDMEWVDAQNLVQTDTLWIKTQQKANVYFRFFEGGRFELTNGKKSVASIFIKSPPLKDGDIEDIRDIEAFPVAFRYTKWLVWLGILLLLCASGYIVYNKIRKASNKAVLKNETPDREISIRERLEAIQKQKGKADKIQWAADELSLTMRLFCTVRYQIAATEMTSEELIQRLKEPDITDEARNAISKVLAYTDRIKFAKAPAEWHIIDQLCEEVKQMEITFTN